VRHRWVLGLTLASLGMWMATQTPLQVMLALQLQDITPRHKIVALGVVTGVGAISSALATPIVGMLSDRTAHGRRIGRFSGRRHRWTLVMAMLSAACMVVLAEQATTYHVDLRYHGQGFEITVPAEVAAFDGNGGGLFVRKIPALRHLVPGGPLGQIMPQIAPGEHEIVIVKQYASAFFGTTLATTLNALGVDTVIIAGVSASGCVRATAVDALQYGFVPLVIREAVGDRDPGPHESALFDLRAKYAEVVGEDSVVSWLGKPLS